MLTQGLRFDVNCSILFTELPLLKRPAAARAAGFGAVEFWWPFGGPVPGDREVDAFIGALADAGVQLALLNFVGGDMAAGERGLLSLPEGSAAFRANIDVCAGIAARTGCTILNALYGPGRARHGRAGLRAAVRSARHPGLRRLDRLRVQAAGSGGQLDELRLEGAR